MLTAITRAVSPAIASCELEFLTREPIDYELAAAQHRDYENCLAGLGAKVISLPAEPALPDSVFVEDPALVFDEVAVITRPGALSRRPECDSLAGALQVWRHLRRLREPATLEGGDVLRVGRRIFVGLSRRTNAEGIEQLRRAVEEFGYAVEAVPVTGCLHLKSAVCHLGDGRLLANPRWFAAERLADFPLVETAPEEPAAANVLALNGALVMPASFPLTADRLRAAGYRVLTLDISELQKAEAGVTCSCLLLET